MAQDTKYYTNGTERTGTTPPNLVNRALYSWWQEYNPAMAKYLDDANPFWIAAMREANRSQRTDLGSSAVPDLLYVMSRDPCGVFNSKPTNEPWNLKGWACFANWYFWLEPRYREELLNDVRNGKCLVWADYALKMRQYCPVPCVSDPAYTDEASIALSGTDPARAYQPGTGEVAISQPFAGNFPAPWPVVGPSGLPISLPGFPSTCTPFPQCLLGLLPAGLTPCTPWPDCIWPAVQTAAAVTPGATVVSSAQGGVYHPAPTADEVASSAAKSSAAPYVIAGLVAVSGIGLLALAASSKQAALG